MKLTGMTDNEVGLALDKKSGFHSEGTKQQSMMVDGNYVGEYLMAKLL